MRIQLAAALLAASALALTGCSVFAPDYAHVDPKGVPSEHTEPGTTLEQDEVARVPFDEPEVDIAVSIRLLEERGSEIFDDLDNASEFDGYTPVVAVVQYDTLDTLTGDDRPSFYSLGGMLTNGEFASALEPDGLGNTCPYSVDSSNGGDGTWRLDCMVYLIPEGEELESIGYYGYNPYSSFGFVSDIGAPYSESPIVWEV